MALHRKMSPVAFVHLVNNFDNIEEGTTRCQLEQFVEISADRQASVDLSSGDMNGTRQVAKNRRVGIAELTGVSFDENGVPIVDGDRVTDVFNKIGCFIQKRTALDPETIGTEGQKARWNDAQDPAAGKAAFEKFCNDKLSVDGETGKPYLFHGNPIYTQFVVQMGTLEKSLAQVEAKYAKIAEKQGSELTEDQLAAKAKEIRYHHERFEDMDLREEQYALMQAEKAVAEAEDVPNASVSMS